MNSGTGCASASTLNCCSLALSASSIALRRVMSTAKPPMWLMAPSWSRIGKRMLMIQA